MNKKRLVIPIITLVLTVIILVGMIASTIILSQKKETKWNYYVDDEKLHYYEDPSEYSFACVTEFRAALKGYIGNTALQFLDLNSKVDKLCDRIILSMEQARIPATKLATIAKVMNENRLPMLFTRIDTPFNTIEEFSEWSDNLVLSVTDENTFSILSSFINSFLEISTLTEEEFSLILYYYLYDYGSDTYRITLELFGKDLFVSFLSDTFFAIRTIYRTNDTKGISLSMNALRASLYQMGKFYIDLSAVGNTERLLGFPEDFPTDNYPGLAEIIDEYYGDIKGSLSNILLFIGHLFTTFTAEELSAYREYQQYKSENYREIAILTELKESELISERELVRLTQLTDKQYRYKIIAAQKMTKALLRGFALYSDREYSEVITSLKDKIITMRTLMFYLSENISYENNFETMELIENDSLEFSEALAYFVMTDYSYDEILNMDDISALSVYADKFESGEELLELYFSSILNVWITYKVNDWGLLSNE